MGQEIANMDDLIVIVGAGPSGLSCALQLARKGKRIILVEQSKSVGGLMRNISWGDFQVDLGRKELYTRLNSVNEFWVGLLADDYVEYDYHVGFLYNGRILEKTSSYKGPKRGMPMSLILRCGLDFVKRKLFTGRVQNYEDFASRSRGRLFNEIFSQGFFEKFDGRLWKDLPVPEKEASERAQLTTIGSLKKFFTTSGDEKTVQEKWRHPRKGAGQITDLIKDELDKYNVDFRFGSTVSGVTIEQGKIQSLSIASESGNELLKPSVVVSSIPLQFAGKTFLRLDYSNEVKTTSLNRGAIIVYLFIDEPSRFPHTWLNVSDQNLKIGRIVNYGNFGGEMVPKDKTCLCVEFFLFSEDELFSQSNENLKERAIREANTANLFDQSKIEHFMVFKLPHANAAVSWKDYVNEPYKVKLYEQLKGIVNLYNVNRAGTDRATHAGLEAAKAILSGDKEQFEKYTDPRLKEPWNQ